MVKEGVLRGGGKSGPSTPRDAAYKSFWERQAEIVKGKETWSDRLVAAVYQYVGVKTGDAEGTDQPLRKYVNMVTKVQGLKAGTLLVSRVTRDAYQLPLRVVLTTPSSDTANGIITNRQGYGGPRDPTTITTLHTSPTTPGRRRVARGLYTNGTPQTPHIHVNGHITWASYTLDREISLGLWAVYRGAAPEAVVDPASELPEAEPVGAYDITNEREEVVLGMVHVGVVSDAPWY
eukprot:TRINITY_DN34072_c0_g1_i1.p1 TRINITY_DN34072_c0_g1~~TRINITY_DN34072_c0_g1_i1.p1  ORF type:complete len:234 (+),score=57.68 TRINITY_DN34072_c0_g1_i1:1-702(+)